MHVMNGAEKRAINDPRKHTYVALHFHVSNYDITCGAKIEVCVGALMNFTAVIPPAPQIMFMDTYI